VFADDDDATLLASALGLDGADRSSVLGALDAIGGLHRLWSAGAWAFDGVLEPGSLVRLDAVLEIAKRILAPTDPPPQIGAVEDVAEYFRPWLAARPTESFWILALDSRLRPLACVPIAEGTLTACIIHPREVYAAAVRSRAASIIAVHNHPSGDPDPSDADEALTDRLTEAGLILGIPLVDHVIVARRGYRSLGRPQAGAVYDSSRLECSRSDARRIRVLKRGTHTWKA
jgi:DNA repair protein RadC